MSDTMGQYFALETSNFISEILWVLQKCKLIKYIFRVHGDPIFLLDFVFFNFFWIVYRLYWRYRPKAGISWLTEHGLTRFRCSQQYLNTSLHWYIINIEKIYFDLDFKPFINIYIYHGEMQTIQTINYTIKVPRVFLSVIFLAGKKKHGTRTALL